MENNYSLQKKGQHFKAMEPAVPGITGADTKVQGLS